MTNPASHVRSEQPVPGALAAILRQQWLAAVLLGLALLIAYLPAIRGGFIWDDDQYVIGNLTLRSLEGLGQIWFKVGAVPQYYPLVHTTFWVEYHLWGLNPLGFHLVNVLLHAIAAFLLWRVLTLLRVPGAWLAAAIFAFHPVHVESVAWITERKNVLSAVFYLAAALACLRFFELKDAGVGGRRTWWTYVVALLLFVAALWSKTVACSLPAALLLVRWWKHGKVSRSDVGLMLPFFVVGAGLAYLTVWMEKHVVGASGEAWALTFVERCLIAGRALWFYAFKLVWPADLTFIYPRWEISAAVWWQWLFPACVIAVVASLWFLRKRLGRGPLVALLFFAGTLFPALGFIDVYPFRYSFVADHFQYLASVGLIILMAAVLVKLPAGFGLNPNRAVVMALPLILLLAALTWKQTHIYHDLETLWQDTLKKSPRSAIAHNNLGTLLTERGNYAEAEKHFLEALQVEPNDPETLSNLGVVRARQGRADEALDLLTRAVTLNSNDAQVQSNLGRVLAGLGRNTEAIEAFEVAIKISPRRAAFYYNLGSVLAASGRTDEAIVQFRQALNLQPAYADAHNNLGLVLARRSEHEQAIQHYLAALRIQPDHALANNNLGDALLRLRNVTEAERHFREAVRLDPSYVNAHLNLGNALALQKRYNEAVEQFSIVVKLSPDHALGHRNLGLALVRTGQPEVAANHFKEVLRLQPDNDEMKQQLRALGQDGLQ